jgi:hypothetical protein
VLAVDKSGMEAASSVSFLDADYTITTTGGEVVVTDLTGTGEVLEISENSGNIRFNVAGKTYSVDGGTITAFTIPMHQTLPKLTGKHIGVTDSSLTRSHNLHSINILTQRYETIIYYPFARLRA